MNRTHFQFSIKGKILITSLSVISFFATDNVHGQNNISTHLASPITKYQDAISNLNDTQTAPEEGKPMPSFNFNDVEYFFKKTASLSDFKGKWLILDFWFGACVQCINSFNKINKLQEIFKDKVQFLLVATIDQSQPQMSFPVTKTLFSKLKEQKSLNLPCAFDDKFHKKWEIDAMPYLIIVNPEGEVYAITTGLDLTAEKLTAMINGQNTTFYNPNKLVEFKPTVDTTSTEVQSSFSKWKNTDKIIMTPSDFATHFKGKKKVFKLSKLPLEWIYNIAYYDTPSPGFGILDSTRKINYPNPILDLKDTSNFINNFEKGNIHLFNYYLYIPDSLLTAERIRTTLKKDLEKTFKYQATMEKRPVPVWKLVAKPGAAETLKTKYEKTYFSDSSATAAAGFEARRYPAEYLLEMIIPYLDRRLPYLDETNLKGYIDVKISCEMSDYNSLRSELNKNYLDLILSQQVMNVLVIRDMNDNR